MFEEMTYDEVRHRRGVFHLREETVKGDMRLWRLIMDNIFVVHCNYYMLSRHFHYHAFSKLFDEIPFNQEAPIYEFRINEYNDLEAVRLDD